MKKNNIERFPNNIFKPEVVEVEDNNYVLYKARFEDLYDLYNYINANPIINEEIFPRLSSVNGESSFAGKPFDEAVEDLINPNDPGYREFLELQKQLNTGKLRKIHRFKKVNTVAGGHLNVPAYSAGNPLCYETEERVSKPKYINVYLGFSYNCGTTKKQVYNRAVIITNIVKALEKAGYKVNVSATEISYSYDEMVLIDVKVKKYSGSINLNTLYKTLCNVEFLRRILFRVLETMDVQERNWGDGYGRTCDASMVRDLLNIGKNELYFGEPREMYIYGDDISDDFESAIEYLNLEDKIDVEKAKREFRNDSKVLRKVY